MHQPEPDAAGISLLYEDANLLVLDKPAGLLSVPGRGEDKQDCLSTRVQARFADALVVHRLDMATSGLLVMARGLAAQQRLNAAFAEREVHKRYVAVVHGHCISEGGDGAGDLQGWHTIDLPIAVDWPRRPLRVIDAAGKPSTTRWQLVTHATGPERLPVSRLLLEPVTGRSHQLRVHLQALGHPILGDALYAPAALAAASPRLLLHASWLQLPHPATGALLQFESPCPF
jgi:tRNA pseudouridine32 synthase / 23S rRNA pseudouridine746 synthase